MKLIMILDIVWFSLCFVNLKNKVRHFVKRIVLLKKMRTLLVHEVKGKPDDYIGLIVRIIIF